MARLTAEFAPVAEDLMVDDAPLDESPPYELVVPPSPPGFPTYLEGLRNYAKSQGWEDVAALYDQFVQKGYTDPVSVANAIIDAATTTDRSFNGKRISRSTIKEMLAAQAKKPVWYPAIILALRDYCSVVPME
jgi:hypothetical protein